MDKDGDQDYVICFTDNAAGAGELAWFERQNDGSYLKHIVLSGKDAMMADLADFDDNGWKDIAVVGRRSRENTLRIYFNSGGNTLSFNEVIVADDCSDTIDAEDGDGDGDIDIAVTGVGLVGNPNTPDSGSRLLLNDSTGDFSLGAWLISVTGGNAALWDNIEIIDFDQNGSKDVIGIRSQATSELIFFDGSSNFSMNFLATEFEESAGDLAIFEIDDNGFLDIVRQGFATDDRIAVFYQESSMNFRREYIDINWDNCCQPVAQFSIGDLDGDGDGDGDGDDDLVFPEQGNVDEDVSWYENINGRLYKHQIYGEWFGIKSVKLLDWDMDDDLDIFATASSGIFGDTEDEVILYENLDGENFLNWRLSDNVDYADYLEYADLDKDGDMDIIVSAKNANNVVWLKNEGFAANWEEDTLFTLADEPTGIAVGYLNADTLPDLVVCSQNDGMLYALINDTNQIFLPLNLDSNVNGPMEVETGDVDNDGNTDIVLAADDGSNSVVIYTNEGGLNFSKEIIHTQDKAQALELMYWNADSILDIFVAFDASDIGLLGLISNGSGYDIDTFEVGNDRLLSLKAADMDEDGSLDLISGHNKGNSVLSTAYLSFIQNGIISSSLPLNDNLNDEITSIDVGDGDGQLDIVYTDFDNDNLILITLDSLGMATSLPKDLATLAKLDMYPNPAQDQVQLSLESELPLRIEAIRFFDLQGRNVQIPSQYVSDMQMILDVSSLPEGIFILQVLTEIGSLNEKIEVKRN